MNRPFAAPGEPVDLRVRACDTASSGLSAAATDHLVTVLFAPANGPKHAVVLTAAPDCSAITPLLAACETQLGSNSAATCVPNATSAMQIIDDSTTGRRLRFNFPYASVCNGGDNDQQFCTSDANCSSGGGTCETNNVLARTLSGPATIVVTPATTPALPCDVATTACTARTGGHCSVTTSQSCTPATQALNCPSGETCKLDVLACIDDFFANDGTCATRTAQGTFNHFTALPVPNDFSADCFTNPSVCTASATEIRVTTDRDGNVLMPMNWQGVLVPSSIPVPRLLRAAISPPISLRLPGQSFMASFTPEGGPLAPIFVPQFDAGAPTNVLNLFGSADAAYTILRIMRRSQTSQVCSGGFNDTWPCNGSDDCPGKCVTGTTLDARCTGDADCAGGGTCGTPGICGTTICFGGDKDGHPCNSDANCPGGECGRPLFDVAGFGMEGGVGPLVISRTGPPGVCQDSVQTCSTTCEPAVCSMMAPCSTGSCVQFALTAEDPVNLQSLATNSQDVFAFTIDEGVDGVDRNGDGDTLDSVVTLRDRTTGASQSLGAPTGCGTFTPATPPGRALVQLHESGQKFPAVSTEGDIIAFLESERGENGCDENGDLDHFDAIVRVFKLGPTELTSAARVADSALDINGQNIVVSNGIVYYRHSEAGQASNSADRASVATGGAEGDDNSSAGASPSISADGRFVAFYSTADTLVTGDTNGVGDTFVHDRCIAGGGAVPSCTPSTERVSLSTDVVPQEGNGGSGAARLSADGRYVAFASSASNLVPGDTNGFADIFLRDRCVTNGQPVGGGCIPTTERISVTDSGSQTGPTDPVVGLGNLDRTISDDGCRIVFQALPRGLTGPMTGMIPSIFVRDRCLSKTIQVGVARDGSDPTGAAGGFSISGNGRYVAFNSNDPNLVPCAALPAGCCSGAPPSYCDGGGTSDVFVRDLETNTTEWISVTPTGGVANSDSHIGSISADGRFVAFQSNATDLAPGATNGFMHIFVRDRATGRTESVSINSDGIEGNNDDFTPIISANGRFVAWSSSASNYLPGDTNGLVDTVVRDRVAGTTEVVSVDSTGAVGACNSGFLNVHPAISADGSTVAFASDCTQYIAGDTNGKIDVYVHGPNASDAASDLTGDGDHDDNVLEQLDTATNTTRTLCPASQVSVVAGAAAFLRPESAGATTNANCTGPTLTGPDLNGDSDSTDEVVHLAMSDGTVQNFGIAATTVSMSGLCGVDASPHAGLPCNSNADCPASTCTPKWIAAAVPPSDGAPGVVEVHAVSDAPSVPWASSGRTADTLQMSGNLAVFLTSEDAENKNLNGDGDKLDRVVQVYDAVAQKLTNTGQAAEEFVIGADTPSCAQGPVIAFRTAESAQNKDLDGDGDKSDYVLQLYVPGIGLINTGQAVTACNLAACDPRFPYRVFGSQVKFLTFEGDQGQDLNGDGDQSDLVLQIYDVCARTTTPAGTVDTTAGSTANPLADTGTQSNTGSGAAVVVAQGGRCVNGSTVLPVPAMCTTDAECPTGATCQTVQVAAAPAVIPHHDSVVLPLPPITATIRRGQSGTTKVLKVKVRNADILPKKELPGHIVRLTASDGTCPIGTVVGLPDFDPATPGDQDSILLPGGATKTASVMVQLTSSAFMTLHNPLAPFRCTLNLAVSAVVAGNADPNPRNDVVPVELNVINLNATQSTSVHESLIKSAAPVKLSIGKSATSATKTVTVKVINADIAPAEPVGHPITLSASDGDCPAGTLTVAAPATQTVAGGKKVTGKVTVIVAKADFASANATPNAKSPGRCTGVLTATTAVSGNSEPDPTNNSTNLVIDVKD